MGEAPGEVREEVLGRGRRKWGGALGRAEASGREGGCEERGCLEDGIISLRS